MYRVDLRYDGTSFSGWQSQTDGSGIQDHLERALATILRHPVRVTGAARTDAGVHAEHQVATFRTHQPFNPRVWQASLQGLLPRSVGVTQVTKAPEDFHPIYSCVGKAYRYRIWTATARHPLLASQCWEKRQALDVGAMREAAQALVGEHDFSAFCAADSSAKTRVRKVTSLTVAEHGALVEIWALGGGFLKQMVRSIAGTLVEVGGGQRAASSVAEVLAGRQRSAAGRTAPAAGLCLVELFYEKTRSVDELRSAAQGGFTLASFA